MGQLEYISLVNKEIIDYYLFIINDEDEKKDFLSTVSKFDIKISTLPVIKGTEFYYKIWILRRGTKKRAHIKQYYSLHMLDNKSNLSLYSPPTLSEILDMIRINTDVTDDFEEYCESRFEDPSDPICRSDYLDDLRRAERFKRFITQEEIRAFPSINEENHNNNKQQNNEEKEIIKKIDLDDEYNLKLLGYSFIFLKDKKQYDKLADLKSILEYYSKIVESYGYDPYTGDYDAKKFPITKEDKQMDSIAKDFKNYFKTLEEYYNYLKELIKKYKIKPTGNLIRRLAFNINTNNDNIGNLEQQHCKFITAVIDWQDFS